MITNSEKEQLIYTSIPDAYQRPNHTTTMPQEWNRIIKQQCTWFSFLSKMQVLSTSKGGKRTMTWGAIRIQ
jgi:hypothetical protein